MLCGLLALGGLVQPAVAQDAEGGARSTITTGIGLEAGRNLDLDPGGNDSTARLTGTLGYAYEKISRTTTLSFGASIRPQTDDNNQDGLYPTLTLRLQHEAPRTKFTFGANYGEAKVTDQSLAFDEDTGAIIEYDGSGTRIVRRATAGVEGGIDMPLGYTLQADRSEVDYRNLSGATSYSPSTFTSLQGGLRADVSAMTRLRLNLLHSRYQSEDREQTRRTTDTASVGIDQRIDAVTALSASVGRSQVKTDRLIREDEDTSGLTFGLGLQRTDPLGFYRADYNRIMTENGKRDNVTIGRDRETPVGKFSGNLGLSNGESGGADWIGRLSYATNLPRDRLSASLTRAVQTDNDGDDVVVTRISGNITHMFSTVNSLDFGVVASASQYQDSDKTRVDATVAYQHRLTQDISLQAGVRLGLAQETDLEDADSQALFLNLTRSFEFLH